MFTMMAMITGIFEDVFVKKEAINRMRDLWWKRTGIISGFILLDDNDDGLLTLDEFIDFVVFLRNDVERLEIIKLFKMLDEDESGTIELNEFVHGVERLSDDYNQGFDRHVLDRVISRERNADGKWQKYKNWLAVVEMVWQSWTVDRIRGFMYILNFWIFCWINTGIVRNVTIQVVAKVLLWGHIVDVMVSVVAMTPHRFWFYSKYYRNEIVTELSTVAV